MQTLIRPNTLINMLLLLVGLLLNCTVVSTSYTNEAISTIR